MDKELSKLLLARVAVQPFHRVAQQGVAIGFGG